ncbi:MAG TPA: TolC family protein [Candidatus Binatia bacterium]
MARFGQPVKESHGRRTPHAVLAGVLCVLSLFSVLLTSCTAPPALVAWDPLSLTSHAPDRDWKPPQDAAELRAAPDAWRVGEDEALPRAGERYDLPAIVDLALRNNPSTRRAWQEARAAAARYGRSLSDYYPEVSVEASAGTERFLFQNDPAPITIKQDSFTPQLELTWTLIDFGRREHGAEIARQQLVAANLAFNREMQDVVFNAQRAYFALDAAKAMERAAERNLELARSVREAAEERLALGLATQPDVLLAKQVEAKAVYDLESASVMVSDAQANLALAIGVPANAALDIVSLEELPLPKRLGVTVEDVIDTALQQRPDLAARVAELRASEAAIGKARAELFPTLGFSGLYGEDIWRYSVNGGPRDDARSPNYAWLVNVEWDLFTGFDRLNAIREAEAQRDAARARLASLELETTAAVWRAYFNYRAARKKYEYAEALLRASQDAYEANRESYGLGLNTIVELLTGERDLANARYLVIQGRAELLMRSAELAWAAGAMSVGALR